MNKLVHLIETVAERQEEIAQVKELIEHKPKMAVN